MGWRDLLAVSLGAAVPVLLYYVNIREDIKGVGSFIELTLLVTVSVIVGVVALVHMRYSGHPRRYRFVALLAGALVVGSVGFAAFL